MAKRKKSVILPEPGAVYAFLLGDGRYGACRVLRGSTDKGTEGFGRHYVLVASSSWIGLTRPEEPDESMRGVLCLTHHQWKGIPDVYWVGDSVPEQFIPIGILEHSVEDAKIKCQASGGWLGAPLQVLAQWRWDHEREQLQEEESTAKAILTAKRLADESAREAERKALTLKQLAKHKFFAEWDDYPSPKAIRASRKIMKETLQALNNLGEKASEAARLEVLQHCIEEFNQLDEALGHFIETTVREDICDEFELLVNACGLHDKKDLADQRREW